MKGKKALSSFVLLSKVAAFAIGQSFAVGPSGQDVLFVFLKQKQNYMSGLRRAHPNDVEQRVALQNIRSAHAFASCQFIGMPPKGRRRADFIQVLYEISVVSAEFGPKAHEAFCALLHKAL